MKRTVVITAVSGAALLGLAACGGASSPAPTAGTATAPTTVPTTGSTPAPGAAASGAPGGAGRGFGGQSLAGLSAQLPQIKQCLSAAGISTADLPTAVPSFAGRPSGAPRPSFNPSDRPSVRPSNGFRGGAAGGRFGGLFQVLSNTQDQAALKACGITVPTLPAGGRFRGGAPATTGATT